MTALVRARFCECAGEHYVQALMWANRAAGPLFEPLQAQAA